MRNREKAPSTCSVSVCNGPSISASTALLLSIVAVVSTVTMGASGRRIRLKTAAVKKQSLEKSTAIKFDENGQLLPCFWPNGCAVSKDGRTPCRPMWLPASWAVGVKTTCESFLRVYISPAGKTYYDSNIKSAGITDRGPEATLRGAKLFAKERIKKGENWHCQKLSWDDDERFLRTLSETERKSIPSVSNLHIAVVSARRANVLQGIKDIVAIECGLRSSGCNSRWYVDSESFADYEQLGLDVVVGGRLTPARNMALEDAVKLGKSCVQVSDDIQKWTYWDTRNEVISFKEDPFVNKLVRDLVNREKVFNLSPGLTACFILGKMREVGAKLGGVYPQANPARAFHQCEFSNEHFILGDFFVADNSPVRFDESMTLKEDYDFTCTHLREHGKVLRWNRLLMTVKHYDNAGGAVSVRNATLEMANIKILQDKWPGVFYPTPGRVNEVSLHWGQRAF